MFTFNPKDPRTELKLRERLVKAYTIEARFFQMKSESAANPEDKVHYTAQSKSALEQLSHIEYSSLDELCCKTESQEFNALKYNIQTIAVDKLELSSKRTLRNKTPSETKQSSKTGNTPTLTPDAAQLSSNNTPKRTNWAELESKLETLAQQQADEENSHPRHRRSSGTNRFGK